MQLRLSSLTALCHSTGSNRPSTQTELCIRLAAAARPHAPASQPLSPCKPRQAPSERRPLDHALRQKCYPLGQCN